eukprot:304925-Chlamydomonas_euryale.AAC.4
MPCVRCGRRAGLRFARDDTGGEGTHGPDACHGEEGAVRRANGGGARRGGGRLRGRRHRRRLRLWWRRNVRARQDGAGVLMPGGRVFSSRRRATATGTDDALPARGVTASAAAGGRLTG